MKLLVTGICIVLVITGGLWAAGPAGPAGPQNMRWGGRPALPNSVAVAVAKGAKWLADVQGKDGGWGQDGGETSYIRTSEHLESNGNDVANTAVAALALLQAGKQYQPNVDRAVDFILKRVEASGRDGLEITDARGTQIQRKLGPYIDTFLTSMLLAQVDGTVSDKIRGARVHEALEKCVVKIEKNQKSDGSWNIAGGWAPVLGTSLASQSLFAAHKKGVKVEDRVMQRAESYTVNAIAVAPASAAGSARASLSDAAGVPLYQNAQALEQLSRTDDDRRKNARQISEIRSQLADTRFVEGFGSIGGEEFFSYLNISDGLKRAGGEEWKNWHSQITQKILSLQNADGTWAGQHCITGRVAVTGAAILNLTVDHAN